MVIPGINWSFLGRLSSEASWALSLAAVIAGGFVAGRELARHPLIRPRCYLMAAFSFAACEGLILLGHVPIHEFTQGLLFDLAAGAAAGAGVALFLAEGKNKATSTLVQGSPPIPAPKPSNVDLSEL
jgi:hypothetical protein